MTIITREQVLEILPKLTAGNREFHTPELAAALSEKLQATIKSDIARYWSNQLTLEGILKRREISARLFVYGMEKTKSKNLSASFAVRHK
jgi:hypothetical protein